MSMLNRTMWMVLALALSLGGCDFVTPPEFGSNIAGQGSSLARFAIEGNDLYIIDKTYLRHFDITDRTNPVEGERIEVNLDVKSIFAYNGHLFLSNQDELVIYSLADRDNPTVISTVSTINACNPVEFQGDFAFVARRLGDECGWSLESELSVYDVSDFTDWQLVRTYSGFNRINSPFALAARPSTLYMCEGTNGFRIYESSDPANLVQIAHTPSFEAFTLVPNGDIAIIKASDGIYQYDISNPLRITLVSRIPLE